jgi:hypothetical protein
MLGNYRVAAQLVATRVVLSSTELVLVQLFRLSAIVSQFQHTEDNICTL